MVSLKALAKNRVLEQMIMRVRQSVALANSKTLNESYITIVVDSTCARILSNCNKMYDLTSNGVAAIEDINKKRQPLPDFSVVYFLTPTPDSIQQLCQDFLSGKQSQYGSVHVYFSLPLSAYSKPIYDKISEYPELINRLRSFVEFNLGFITFERRVFHCVPQFTLRDLFYKSTEKCLQRIADELFTYCITLGDRPNIRFHSNKFGLNEKLATILHKKLQTAKIPGITQGKTDLVIVDRSIDLPPLFIHEYTYQAYIYDMLKIPVASTNEQLNERNVESEIFSPDNTITYTPSAGTEKKALLGEQDHVFVQYRHQHLMVALKKISEDLKTFIKENAAAKLKRKNQELTNEDLQKAIRDLPAYQEMLAKYSLHNTITQQCFAEFQRSMLSKVGAFEQDIATGVDHAGKEISVKKCLATLGSLLPDPSVKIEDKARMLLLYFSMVDGIKEIDTRKMIEAAQLPLETTQTIREFLSLNLTGSSNDSTSNNHVHRLHNDKERLSYFMNHAKKTEILLSRFEPYLKNIMMNAAQKNLHGGIFPYVADPTYETSQNGLKAQQTRVRLKNWNFESDEKTDAQIDLEQNENIQQTQQNTVVTVFVIGGITFSETRCAYEVSRDLGCDIFIGGTTILTPPLFLKQLKNITKKNI